MQVLKQKVTSPKYFTRLHIKIKIDIIRNAMHRSWVLSVQFYVANTMGNYLAADIRYRKQNLCMAYIWVVFSFKWYIIHELFGINGKNCRINITRKDIIRGFFWSLIYCHVYIFLFIKAFLDLYPVICFDVSLSLFVRVYFYRERLEKAVEQLKNKIQDLRFEYDWSTISLALNGNHSKRAIHYS